MFTVMHDNVSYIDSTRASVHCKILFLIHVKIILVWSIYALLHIRLRPSSESPLIFLNSIFPIKRPLLQIRCRHSTSLMKTWKWNFQLICCCSLQIEIQGHLDHILNLTSGLYISI